MNMTYSNEDLISLFSCVKIVKGFKNGIICDLQRKQYTEIPLLVCDLILKITNEKLNVYNANQLVRDNELTGLIEWLLNNDFIFMCKSIEELNNFPEISENWEYPMKLSNAIVDIECINNYSIDKALIELSEVNCDVLQFRFFKELDQSNLNNLLQMTIGKSFTNIELIIPNSTYTSDSYLKELIVTYSNIISIIIYSSNNSSTYSHQQSSIYYTTQDINSETDCGNINKKMFVCDLSFFNEAKSFNTCFNKKISIDKNGEIKNCPSLRKSFGNIANEKLKEIVQREDFDFFGNIKKDNIEVCKVCEYRYMCPDCRAYLKDANDIYSQPAKCYYNPYIAKWKGEDGYISVDEIGRYNKNGEFIIKEKYGNSFTSH